LPEGNPEKNQGEDKNAQTGRKRVKHLKGSELRVKIGKREKKVVDIRPHQKRGDLEMLKGKSGRSEKVKIKKTDEKR